MLGVQKRQAPPLEFWTTSFHAVVDAAACEGCGRCVERCQVNAVGLGGSPEIARIDLDRCTGCGLCVPKCGKGY